MADPKYPIPRFYFEVSWGDLTIPFSEVTGLVVETEMIEYRHGNSPLFHKIKMPGLQKNMNLTLKKGIFKAENHFFEAWNNVLGKGVNSPDYRKNILITLKDENGEPVVAWNIERAWAVKVTSPDLKSDANEVAIETIELAHEGITVKNPAS